MKEAGKGIYKRFFYVKEGLSFSTIKDVITKNTSGREELEDTKIKVDDIDNKVYLSFSIEDKHKVKEFDDIVLETLKRIREDLIRLRKLKSDLILLGVYESPITINWYRY